MNKERFDSSWTPEPNSGCWLWTGAVSGLGYGSFHDHGKTLYAHRMSWEFYRGEIPEGMSVLHYCDTPLCCNPIHLFLGTNADNRRDSVNKKRHAFSERHGMSKLSAEDVRKIRNDTRLQRVIAEEFGIDQVHVSNIKRGQRWKYLA